MSYQQPSFKYFCLCLCIAIVALVAFTPFPAQAKAVTTCGSWQVVPSPNMGSGKSTEANRLYAVASTAPNDVWAVGTYYYGGTQALIEHWDGTSWKITPSPTILDSTLEGITRVPNTTNFWAVGSYFSKRTPYTQALFEFWNGSKWKVIPSPRDPSANVHLSSMIALSANDVWAVGYSRTFKTFGDNTFTEHWDGTQWSIVPSPNPTPDSSFLVGVAHVPGTVGVWAVGFSYNQAGFSQTLTEYWNGTTWEVVSSPNVAGTNNSLSDVYAFAANNIWTVGYTWAVNFTSTQTLIEHWDGAVWSIVPSPNVDVYNDLLNMTAISANSIWAVGNSAPTMGATAHTLIEDWNGTAWTVVASPNVGSANYLVDVGYVARTNQLWAVGYFDGFTLVESYC